MMCLAKLLKLWYVMTVMVIAVGQIRPQYQMMQLAAKN